MRKRDQLLLIPFMGGLGNQLFQYAAGIYSHKFLSKKSKYFYGIGGIPTNTDRAFMLGDLLRENEIEHLGRRKYILLIVLTKLKLPIWVQEKNESDFPIERLTRKTKILVGFFQKRIYVEPVATEILAAMSTSSLFNKVVSAPTKSDIAVHIRLGDYASKPTARHAHGLSEMTYFVDAVRVLQSKRDYDNIVIYSDEAQTAYAEFVNVFGTSSTPITVSSGTNEYEDLAGISSSKGIVISNSTFSWWAAWIGTHLHNSTVIAPRPWFSKPSAADEHLLLESWIVLDREIQS